jgi:RNA polymerase sigma-70 factor (ECF subfamily)
MATSRTSDARAAVDRSFEQLYRGHHADVFRAALRELGNVHDAEDVTQAAFVDAYRAVLRGSRPQAPRAWLLAIAENVRRRRYRTAQRRPREEPLDADFPLAAELPTEHAHALAEALAELPAEQRRVFVLRELGDRSYEEIAEETGSTVGAVQMQLFRARRSLRELLEPPTVARRRAGLVLPVPGWLATLVSRAEVITLTPRATGAVGATVVAVVGATVAATEVAADSVAPAPVVEPRPAIVSVVRPVAGARPETVDARQAVVRSPAPKRASKPAARQQPRPAPAPAAPAPLRAVTPAPPTPAAAPRWTPPAVTVAKETLPRVLERPRLPVRVDEKVGSLLEKPVPPLSTAPVLEAVTGAAGAAGAGATPLPVPGVPPPVLPPVP